MMFTDRFITIPIKIYNSEHKDLTGNEVCEDTLMRINPFEISRYFPTVEEDNGTDIEVVKVTFRDGDSVICYMSISKFEETMNKSPNH